jgi:murein L,D-transpeptidase YafK
VESRTVVTALLSAVFLVNAHGALGEDRVVAARRVREGAIRARCETSGLPYPPRELFIRAFKREGEVETWAREVDGPFRLVATFPVTAASGGPGPKRKQGDKQVPEGCYRISVFNPQSKFHLSLGLDYPNASDRIRSDRAHPGAEIYIHGRDRSVGCLPLGDPAIEELYLLALDVRARSQRQIPAHIFPARMRGAEWQTFRAQHPQHAAFWKELAPIYEAFEATRQMPKVEITATGAYRLIP